MASQLASIARPYAQGAIAYAQEQGSLEAWQSFFKAILHVTQHAELRALLSNPLVDQRTMLALMNDALGQNLDQSQTNFLTLLAENKRLNLLPEVAILFNQYYAALKRIRDVRVVTAVTAPESFHTKLIDSLTKRLHGDIKVHAEVDAKLIGGAVIYFGDQVIDGSIRGKLTRLLNSLTG